MTVIIVVISLVLGSFIYNPMWFDTRPHYYSHTYNSKEECQKAKKSIVDKKKGAVCTDKNALYITK
mgnify:FL=1